MNLDNKPESVQPEQKPEPRNQSRLTSIRHRLAGLKDSYIEHTLERIPADKINSGSVAQRILNNLGNPLRERVGQDRYANPFDITAVIAELGYIGTWFNTDYLKKFPEVYAATRQALFSLEQDGALESRDFDEANSNGETKFYKVIDAPRLKQIVDEAKTKKP